MTKSVSEAYVHEDDYGQQEILPLASLDFCRQQIAEQDEFSKSHQAPDGNGWTEVYVRSESPQKLSDVGIPIAEFRRLMAQYLCEVPVVYSGYGTQRVVCEHTIGFGSGDDCMIFANWNDSGMVENIWTSLFSVRQNEIADAISALEALGQIYRLLYVDWVWSFAMPIDGTNALKDCVVSKVLEIEHRIRED